MIQLMIIMMHPSICVERRKTDEKGRQVMVRFPVVGFRSCRAPVFLEDIERCPAEGVPVEQYDARLFDGYRYGDAIIGIPV